MIKRTLFLAPASNGVGLTTIALGLVRALDRQGVRVGFCKPIGQAQGRDQGPERSTHFIRATTNLRPTPHPISLADAERRVGEGHLDELLATVLREFHESAGDAEVMVVEGLLTTAGESSAALLNLEMVKTLGADVILVAAAAEKSMAELELQLEYAAQMFNGADGDRVVGGIINRVKPDAGQTLDDVSEQMRSGLRLFQTGKCELVGCVPWDEQFSFCRTVDVARHLEAKVLYAGEIDTRRVRSTTVLARTVPNVISSLIPGALLVTPCDRCDIMVAVAMATMHKRQIAGVVLTGNLETDQRVMDLCAPAFEMGLPVMHCRLNSYETATRIHQMSSEVPVDDLERIQAIMDHVARNLNADWLRTRCVIERAPRMSPAAFCFQLAERAQAADKRIILPEGAEPRTVRAAVICTERRIARCVLLGDPEEIREVARGLGLELPEGVEILDAAALRPSYVDTLVEMRKSKGLTPDMAFDQLEDTVMLGTVMLALGQVDGLVSGAVHSSANTIRPALQIIKTKPGAKVVSSVFFMCLPEQVLVYGDCAVNPDPDADALADIAIQSAESARQFGIEPRVAMLSYSTGESGAGADVEKVRAATRIAQEKRPDLLIDGPLQYDAAAIAEVAATKAPNSPVAGRATVFVFPDLNTGNTTYKAVQRAANVISVGPMLQGLKRPVNDLSRGALVDDIVYTIALTAIQAAQPASA